MFLFPIIAFGQTIPIGTPKSIVEIRGGVIMDSSIRLPLRDTSKKYSTAGYIESFLGNPYWWNGSRWYRLNGDTTTSGGQVNSDWNATSGVALILNKPTLATVATSGSYINLTDKPTIPAAQVNSDWNAASGLSQILNKPRFLDSFYRKPGKDSLYYVINRGGVLYTYNILDSLGSGGGNPGTVTSVAIGNLNPIFSTTVNNATSTPSAVFTLQNAPAHTFLGDTTGSTGAPGYYPISIADLPNGIPISKTLLTAVQGIILTGNQLKSDTNFLATQYDVTHINYSSIINPPGTPTLQQVITSGNTLTGNNSINTGANSLFLNGTGAFGNTVGTTVQRPGSPSTGYQRWNTDSAALEVYTGTAWVRIGSGSGGGAQSVSGAVNGIISGTNIPTTLATVNSNVFASNTLLKHTATATGLITSAVAATSTDITTILGYIPYYKNDTLGTLATKTDLTKIDTIRAIAVGNNGFNTIYGRNDTLFNKKLVNAIQNSDSSLTVGNVVASNNLSDLSNTNTALNNLLPSQTGFNGYILSTNGINSSWIVNSGGSGNTNISVTASATADTIKSSTGTSGILTPVTYSVAGPMIPSDKKRLDSTLNLANTRVGDTIAYLNATADTVFLKGINITSTAGTITVTKNNTQKGLSYNLEYAGGGVSSLSSSGSLTISSPTGAISANINPSFSNTFTAGQNFGAITTTGVVTFSNTSFINSNGKLDYLIQDTTTGVQYRAPYIPIDTTGKANGYVLTWNSGSNKATFVSPGVGGTVTTVAANSLAPIFTTVVNTATTTPSIVYTLSNAAAYTQLGNYTASAAAPTYGKPGLTTPLFGSQGTASTVLHGNASSNLTFSAVSLTTDVSGQLPIANGGIPAGGTALQALVKNSSTNYDASWLGVVNSLTGTTNQISFNASTGNVTASLPQNINTSANVTFGSQTLSTGDLLLSRTDQAYANITRPNTTGAKSILFSVTGGGVLDNYTVNSTNSGFSGNLAVSNNETVGGTFGVTGTSTFGNKATFVTPTTTIPSINLPAGAAETSPVSGDLSHVTGHLYFTDGSTTYDLLAPTTPVNIYNTDGTLTGARIVNQNGNGLSFKGGNIFVEGQNQNSLFLRGLNGDLGWRIGRSANNDNNNDFFILNENSSYIMQINSSNKTTFNYQVQVADGTQGAGKVFTSDASGNGSWVTPNIYSSQFTPAQIGGLLGTTYTSYYNYNEGVVTAYSSFATGNLTSGVSYTVEIQVPLALSSAFPNNTYILGASIVDCTPTTSTSMYITAGTSATGSVILHFTAGSSGSHIISYQYTYFQ